MNSEWNRLASFHSYPINRDIIFNSITLAGAGFYYNNTNDEILCFSCGKQLINRNEEDIIREHKRLSPHCKFITGFNNADNNISIYNRHSSSTTFTQTALLPPPPQPSTIIVQPSDAVSSSWCDNRQFVLRESTLNSRPSSDNNVVISDNQAINQAENQEFTGFSSGSNNNNNAQEEFTGFSSSSSSGNNNAPSKEQENGKDDTLYRNLGICVFEPKHSQYQSIEERIASYKNWPSNYTQTPQDLAKAGLYFTGDNDTVKCFYCGKGLYHWDPGDDPFIEHARWFPECAFLRQYKGDGFVQKIQSIKKRQDEHFRKNKDLLSHRAVESVLEMGVNEYNLRTVLLEFEDTSPQLTAENLLIKLWEIEDKKQEENKVPPPKEENKATPPPPEKECKDIKKKDENEELEKIKQEYLFLKEQQLCKICCEEIISIVFLPCGHFCTCVDCANAVKKCPICRQFIKGTVKTYI